MSASLETASSSINPTKRIQGGTGGILMPGNGSGSRALGAARGQDVAMSALARLTTAAELKLREDTKFAGMFRAHGLLGTVWDLPAQTAAGAWEQPVAH